MSQNIFELVMDPGVDADIASMKSKMLILLNTKLNESLGVKKGKASRKDIAEKLSISITEASRIATGKMDSLSVERLMRYLFVVGVKLNTDLVVDCLQSGDRVLVGLEIKTVNL